MCGICAAEWTVSWSSRRSWCATTPRPSIGDMHCRAVRMRRRTLIAARARIGARSSSTNVSSTTLSPQCSWTSGAPGLTAATMSTTAGSSSKSTSTSAAMSSASARVGATHIATSSPTWRTLSFARTCCGADLKPFNAELATIGLTPARSSIVKTACSWPAGLRTARMRACAIGERTNATSSIPTMRMLPTYSPRPRRKRSSSLRRSRAPTPLPARPVTPPRPPDAGDSTATRRTRASPGRGTIAHNRASFVP